MTLVTILVVVRELFDTALLDLVAIALQRTWWWYLTRVVELVLLGIAENCLTLENCQRGVSCELLHKLHSHCIALHWPPWHLDRNTKERLAGTIWEHFMSVAPSGHYNFIWDWDDLSRNILNLRYMGLKYGLSD